MEVQLVAMLAVALATGSGAYALTRRRPRLTGPLAGLGFAVLALSVLPRLLPAELYFLYPAGDLGEIGLAAAFALPGALAGGYRDTAFRVVLHALLAPVMVYFVLGPTAYLAWRGEYIRGLDHRVVDGVTLQSEDFGCVPSSLATVLRRYGLELSEGELALALRTTPMGTDFIRIPEVVERFGAARSLAARFVRPSIAELRAIDRPGVLMVYSGPIRHAVALLGFDGDDMIVGEPLLGRVRIPAADFRARSRWTGLAVLIAPAETSSDGPSG